jgi:hypothetical protein
MDRLDARRPWQGLATAPFSEQINPSGVVPMPKKNNSKKSTSPAKKIASVAKRVVTKVTEVRNTPIPKIAKKAATPVVIAHHDIAKRAYEIHCSGTGGSETDNWYRAERELRGL